MADLDTLASQIIAEDRRLKAETKRLEALKKDLLGMMEAENIGEVNVKEGRIIRCARTSKDYGETIKNLEANLKAEKTRLDYLGQYVIKSVTNYLRVGWYNQGENPSPFLYLPNRNSSHHATSILRPIL